MLLIESMRWSLPNEVAMKAAMQCARRADQFRKSRTGVRFLQGLLRYFDLERGNSLQVLMSLKLCLVLQF